MLRPVQVPGVIVMEVASKEQCTKDTQWQCVLITFNASNKEYTGAPFYGSNKLAIRLKLTILTGVDGVELYRIH